ncbi:MAG: hypothetical protein GY941_06410 [Planctomycetes bacterium]|nr:hypothetical protein [Planctomycetota bacterium]
MALSIEQLESWKKEATIHFDKLQEVDEMINRKLVDKNLAKRMRTVAEDNLQILISKLRNSLEDSKIPEMCGVLDKIKNNEVDSVIKDALEGVVKEKYNEESCIGLIKNDNDHILILAMQIIKKLII